ncbi:MAG: hypothetical protein ACR2N7_05565 [Acidimicrobiia bacterium]
MSAIRVLALLGALAVMFQMSIASAAEVPPDLLTGFYSDDFDAGPDLDGVAAAAGQRVTFAGTFHDIAETNGFGFDPNNINHWSNTRESLEAAWQAEATPFANVHVNGSAFSIARGDHDAQITEWVRHVKSFLDRGGNRSLIVAPLQEHNGNWTPYGCSPANFRTAYQKFVQAFADAGIDESQVRFAWAPNGWTSPGCGSLSDYYPGDGVVDVVSISAYNFGNCLGGSTNESPAQVFDPWLNEIRNTIPGTSVKPFVIAQTASPRTACGGSQQSWITTMVDHLDNDPNVVGFVWFNFNKSGEPDFRVWTGSLAQGWKDAVASGATTYTWPLTSWFSPGALRLGDAPPEDVPCDKGPCDAVATVDSGGQWSVWDELSSTTATNDFFFGNPGDTPFMGDWNGDGIATPGLYRQSDGYVYVRFSNTQGVADREFFFGNPGDVPLIGDFNGDGKDSVSIWRSSEARVYVINELGEDGKGLGAADFSFYFGNSGDQPFVGDFNGDGIDTIGLYRQSTGFVYFRDSLTTGVADLSFFYGNPGDVIMAGDWDGDGDDTVAVYRPSTRRVYMNLENSSGAADWSGYVGSFPHIVRAGNR